VNTVYRTPGGWAGTNTDVQGFLAPLLDLTDWRRSVAVVLGNGGAARAVVAGCAQLGCQQIHVVGRQTEKLQSFLKSWQHSPQINLSVHSWEDLPQLLPQTHLLVNTTPIGMAPQSDTSPLSPEAMQQLPAEAIVYDLIYTPRPTQFLQQAQAQGLKTFDGLEMLVQQGAAALQLWLQQSVPVEVMRRSLQEHLEKQSAG
jgi:shikimate dehydrogenase